TRCIDRFVVYFTCTITYLCCFIFFFTDTPTTEIYTLSLHDALPISLVENRARPGRWEGPGPARDGAGPDRDHVGSVYRPLRSARSEEHTSELQSRSDLVCRLLLEKKKIKNILLIFHINNLFVYQYIV